MLDRPVVDGYKHHIAVEEGSDPGGETLRPVAELTNAPFGRHITNTTTIY